MLNQELNCPMQFKTTRDIVFITTNVTSIDTYHDVEDDTEAPDISHLRNVGDAHEYLWCSVGVAATERFTFLKFAIYWQHTSARKTEVDNLYASLQIICTGYSKLNDSYEKNILFLSMTINLIILEVAVVILDSGRDVNY